MMYEMIALGSLLCLHLLGLQKARRCPIWVGITREVRFLKEEEERIAAHFATLPTDSVKTLRLAYVFAGGITLLPILFVMTAFPGLKTFAIGTGLLVLSLQDLIGVNLHPQDIKPDTPYRLRYLIRRAKFCFFLALWIQVFLQV